MRNLDPEEDETLSLKSSQDFLKAMRFLDDFDLDENIDTQPMEVFDESDRYFEDAFIEEMKKHTVLYDIRDPDNKKTKLRQEKWEKISVKFGETEKKLQLKWKNLKRKYILMRYPTSSRNSITQKRKIRYSPAFVEKMKFLDKYLEHSQLFDAIDNVQDYQSQMKKMKFETTENVSTVSIHKFEIDRKSGNVFEVSQQEDDEDEEIYEIEEIEQPESIEESSQITEQYPRENFEEITEHMDEQPVTEEDFESEIYEQHFTEVPQEAQQTHPAEETEPEIELDQQLSEDTQEHAAVSEISIDRRCENEIFCLSLVDTINRLSYPKQLVVKAKIWQLLAESQL